MNTEVNWKKRTAGQVIALAWPLWTRLQDYRVMCRADGIDPARPHAPALFIFWHEFLAALCPRWGHSNLTLLISQHRDGEWINQVAVALGYQTVRGSSTRGGTTAVRQMVAAAQHSSIVVTPDGPQGPRRQMSAGAAYLGAKLQIPIIPVGVGVNHCWRLKTWDQTPFPKPFSQVRVVFGSPLRLSTEVRRESLSASMVQLQTALDDVNDQAQAWAEGRVKLIGYAPRSARHRRRAG